jgi:hypothetical protein
MPIQVPPDSGVPPPSGKPGGIGEKLENALVRFLTRALNSVKLTLAGVLRFALDTFLEGLEPVLDKAYRPLLNVLWNAPGCSPELKSLINTALSGESQTGAALLGFLGQSVGGAAIGSITGSLFAPTTMWVNAAVRPQRPDLMTAQALLRRKAISDGEYATMIGEVGWSDRLAGAVGQLTHPRPDFVTLAMDAFRRDQPLESIRDELDRRGFLTPDIDKLLNVAKPIPGPGDLISMAVREAWDDGVAARYGYDADFPAPFAEWMKKQGFDEEWAHRWWRAHWELPGPTMGAEMLHRTSMTEADYATLLRIADYPQQWRQWMTEIAYAPYTRVDIRRMFQVGVLKTYQELVRAYKDIGYKDDKAQKLADFTVLEYGETEKEATKSEVLSAYQIGRLSQAEARGYLAEMMYPAWLIDAFIARVDLTKANALAKQQIDYAKTLYVNGQFSKSDVYTVLNKVPLTAAEVEMYLAQWDIARSAKDTRPTRADLRKFFIENLISVADFQLELKGWHLSDKYINWYVADAMRDLVKTATSDVSTASAEVTRVGTAVAKTVYDVQAADIAVQIAKLNLTIADLKASSTPEMTLAELTELGDLVVNCQLQIKALQLEKAQVWAAYLREKGGT